MPLRSTRGPRVTLVSVIERRIIGEDLLGAFMRWQQGRGQEPVPTPESLELLCQNVGKFAPGAGRLRLAIPPGEVLVGDEVDIEGAEPLGIDLPTYDDPTGVPETWAAATAVTKANGHWLAMCSAVA